MLEIKGLSVAYGKHRALESVALQAAPGEIVVILGANGAGKSTLLKAIGGICEGRVSGTASMNGEPLLGLPPHKVVERGVALVPEGRGVFGDLSVRDNLMLGANPHRAREDAQVNFDRLVNLFPKLAERAGQTVRTMSGGEQQMVAIGRAMMSNPTILMLDEPSLGLSPLLSKELFQNLKAVRDAGLGILLVEQNARLSLGIADRGYLLENGEILREDRASILRNDPAVQAAYLGAGSSKAAARPAPVATVAAAAPTNMPMPVSVRQKCASTVSAAQVAGLDIASLVARAAQQAQPTRKPLSPANIARPDPQQQESRAGAAGRRRPEAMARMLAEMEAAARNARSRDASSSRTIQRATSLPPLRSSIRQVAAVANSADPAPAPKPHPDTVPPQGNAGKVTIYRRRPGSSQFDRSER